MENHIRYQIILGLFAAAGILLVANLMRYQIIDESYRNQAQNRTLTKRTISPPRGIIKDRNGKLLVVNEATYELEMIYREIDPEMDIENFCELLGISKLEYEDLLNRATSKKYFRKSIPISFYSNIEPTDFARFQEHMHKFPGFYTRLKNKRSYPYPHAAHVLGYISEVSSEDIANTDIYEIGDIKGTKGLEKVYEDDLRGGKGLEYVLKDNIGREIEPYRLGSLDESAEGGQDLITSLDIDLQSYGEQLLQGKRGSVVAIEPSTGEILAMVSGPSYDPNQLSLGKTRNETFLSLLQDTVNRPMLDRSLQAKYPPGSIFKPILSLIALQEGITYHNRTISCNGEYRINENYVQGCREHPTPYNIGIALQHSCNTYYYQILREFLNQFGWREPGKALALLNQYLDQFGIGRELGVDIGGEASGFNPTPEFYDKKYNTPQSKWASTYILSLGIGQGELELTTIQMANLAAIIANRGYYYIPHVLKEYESGKLLNAKYSVPRRVAIDSIHFPPVINGMERVIDSGTGYRAYVPGISICGKTGTSENPFGDDHSVFFGFAPREKPEIAIAVFVENAGGGGTIAAPIGGLMIEKYLNGEIRKSREYLESYITDYNLINIP